MGAKKRRTKWLTVTTMLACIVGSAAMADARKANEPGATLYEVTENMYFYDRHGVFISPDKILGGLVAPAFRVADATLQGTAALGTPLCPSALLLTNPRAKTCTVTAAGTDNIDLQDFKGSVSGTYAVVLNVDNPTDAAEYVVQTGTFVGEMDLSKRPLGSVKGTFTPTLTQQKVKFEGTFRLPFNLDTNGRRNDVKRGRQAYYLADDGQTVIPVHQSELSLGVPLVRLELNF